MQDVIKSELNQSKENEEKLEEYWNETENTVTCTVCLTFASSPNRPSHLKALHKNNFGIYQKNRRGTKYEKEQKGYMNQHLRNNLHRWCAGQYKQKLKNNEEREKMDKKGSEMIVSNAVFCLKNGYGAFDFRKLNDKDELTLSNLEGVKFPEKNDGLNSFFELRGMVHSEIMSIAKDRFSDLKNISFSLDKVTVSNIPYTVLVTYYFYLGKIYIYLNRIHPMLSTEYDGESTAKFVADDLMMSLGYSRYQLAEKVVHVAYDGVYATPEERSHGGGCLSLTKKFAEHLDLDPDLDFGGSWDLGHLLQLAIGDAFKDNPDVEEFNRFMYTIMSEHKSHQSGLRFNEIAEELHHACLTNKGLQETRWARSVLRCLQAFLRNTPTFSIITGRTMEEARERGDNTTFKEQDKIFKSLSNGSIVCLAVGLCQILEIYSQASLSFQDIRLLACTIPETYNTLHDQIKTLSDNWAWKDEDLKLAGIGNPSQIIEGLKNGKYSPDLSKAVKVAALRRHNTLAQNRKEYAKYLEECGEVTVTDLQDDITEEEISAGEMVIEEFDQTQLERVEMKLTFVAKDILRNFCI